MKIWNSIEADKLNSIIIHCKNKCYNILKSDLRTKQQKNKKNKQKVQDEFNVIEELAHLRDELYAIRAEMNKLKES